jgi:general secretion pathway protein N
VKRVLRIALLVAGAFFAIVIARLPAAWLLPTRLPQGSCASIDGTLWSGTCTGLSVAGASLGDLGWQLRPLRLLAGKLAGHVTLTGAASAAADVEVGFGQRITARNLVVEAPLDPRLMPGVPPGLHGRAHADLAQVQLTRGVITQLKGRIEVHDVEESTGNRTPLGSYAVTFPGGSGTPTGTLRDLDGPLAVEGTLRLTPQPGFELEGLVAARHDAPQELVNNIRFLGSPDASGRRPFSLSGTF